MRELARWQEDRYAAVAAWSLREALLAYVELLRVDAREAYAREIDRYWCGNMKDKPKPPAIVANDDGSL